MAVRVAVDGFGSVGLRLIGSFEVAAVQGEPRAPACVT